jgi:hypothetical protein
MIMSLDVFQLCSDTEINVHEQFSRICFHQKEKKPSFVFLELGKLKITFLYMFGSTKLVLLHVCYVLGGKKYWYMCATQWNLHA